MKGIRYLLGIVAIAAMSACSSADNVGACEGYVSQINSLECFGGAQLDPMTTCSGYESTSCDISEYFDCLTENTQCMDVGGVSVPDTSGTASCAALARCD